MKNITKTFNKWHCTKTGYLIMGVIELGFAYILGSRALDTGSWAEYLLTVILLMGGLRNVFSFVRISVSKNYGNN